MKSNLHKCASCSEWNSVPVVDSDEESRLRDEARGLASQLKYYQNLNLKLLEDFSSERTKRNRLEAFILSIQEIAFVAAELKNNPDLGIPELPPALVPLGVSGIQPSHQGLTFSCQ